MPVEEDLARMLVRVPAQSRAVVNATGADEKGAAHVVHTRQVHRCSQ